MPLERFRSLLSRGQAYHGSLYTQSRGSGFRTPPPACVCSPSSSFRPRPFPPSSSPRSHHHAALRSAPPSVESCALTPPFAHYTHAVPYARPTMPESPSMSKNCWYPNTAFAPRFCACLPMWRRSCILPSRRRTSKTIDCRVVSDASHYSSGRSGSGPRTRIRGHPPQLNLPRNRGCSTPAQ